MFGRDVDLFQSIDLQTFFKRFPYLKDIIKVVTISTCKQEELVNPYVCWNKTTYFAKFIFQKKKILTVVHQIP